ncbi:hypothetical protein HT105_23765, partial [Bacteroides fragilis]|nr:hypothetical protein [Bacteroides fragilis]
SNRDSYTVVQRFFGRFGIFALIGFFQSTLLSLGLIFFVQLEPAHPVLLWLAAWVSSAVFMMIIYTLVVSSATATLIPWCSASLAASASSR